MVSYYGQVCYLKTRIYSLDACVDLSFRFASNFLRRWNPMKKVAPKCCRRSKWIHGFSAWCPIMVNPIAWLYTPILISYFLCSDNNNNIKRESTVIMATEWDICLLIQWQRWDHRWLLGNGRFHFFVYAYIYISARSTPNPQHGFMNHDINSEQAKWRWQYRIKLGFGTLAPLPDL